MASETRNSRLKWREWAMDRAITIHQVTLASGSAYATSLGQTETLEQTADRIFAWVSEELVDAK